MNTYYIEDGSEYASIVQTEQSVHTLSQQLERKVYRFVECKDADDALARLQERGKEYIAIDSWYK